MSFQIVVINLKSVISYCRKCCHCVCIFINFLTVYKWGDPHHYLGKWVYLFLFIWDVDSQHIAISSAFWYNLPELSSIVYCLSTVFIIHLFCCFCITCRVSWCVIGEEEDSWGYGGTAKFSTNNKFSNFGRRFTKGDVIMAMVDFESRPPKISFAVNGDWLGVAQPLHGYKVGNTERALFPHILSKNCRYIDGFLFVLFFWMTTFCTLTPFIRQHDKYPVCKRFCSNSCA